VDELYDTIQKDQSLKTKIKVIGIGAGNNQAEVDIFRQTYKVPFPLFADDDFVAHKALGQVKTPYFIGVRIHNDGSHEVFYSKLGAFKKADEFLKLMITLSGVK
jgi:peroxiredoxin